MNANHFYQTEKNKEPGILMSVIIPAHNAESTLQRAVESALGAMRLIGENETVSRRLAPASMPGNLPCEILIIENGSEDATEFLGARLQTRYPDTVRLLRSEKGVSNARNRGLDEAKGKWILFLDADDYFLEEAGSVLVDDLFFSGTDLIAHSFESGDRIVHICPAGGERYSGDITGISARMIENPTRYTQVWSKLFRRDRIEYGGLRFDPALRLSEDSLFFIRYLSLCKRIRLIDRPFYHYSTDNDSAVRTWDGKKEEGYRRSLEAVQAYLKTQPQPVRQAAGGYGMMQFNLLMVREIFSADLLAGPVPADSPETAGGAKTRKNRPVTMRQKICRMVEISREEPFASAITSYDPRLHKGVRYLPIRLLRSGFAAGAAALYQARVLQNAKKERMH